MKYLSKLSIYTSKHWCIVVFIIFFAVNLLFNYHSYWSELWHDSSRNGSVTGEVYGVEWGSEQIYEKLISGKNPFTPITAMLYPFGINIVAADPGSGFFFLLFRSWLSLHQSFALLVILLILLANTGMYFLLRRLWMLRSVSLIVSLAYGYMTFITVQSGHPNYLMHYVFPWFYFSVFSFLRVGSKYKKILSVCGVALFFVLTLWMNMYYFIILLISLLTLGIYILFAHRKVILSFLRTNFGYIICCFLLMFLFLLPWLKAVYETYLFSETPRTFGWGGAIEFSSDLLNYFIPSGYNRYYAHLIYALFKDVQFVQIIYENFTYPGIIILIVYTTYFVYYRKKISVKLKRRIQPFLIVSLVFWVLTLGPFLHIAGRWKLAVDDGIQLVFPLPFIILHYIPFLGNIRAPGRLIVGFIFFAYIVVAYLITYTMKRVSIRMRYILFIILFSIFIIDHRYTEGKLVEPYIYPHAIFNNIKDDPEEVNVLEIPFTVRDGFTYFGDLSAISMIVGQQIHKKPVLGGYAGRIPDYIKYYYQENPFFGYIGRKIDGGIEGNPIINQKDLLRWQTINIALSKKTADFLDIKYIILKNDMSYVTDLLRELKNIGYNKKLIENKHTLLVRIPQKTEFLKVDMQDPSNSLFLGLGWYPQEEKIRWSARRSAVMFKLYTVRDMNFEFMTASFHANQPITIYVNKRKVARMNVTTAMSKYTLSISKNFLKKGINDVHFIFDKSYQPSRVLSGSFDERKLGGMFTEINLLEKGVK